MVLEKTLESPLDCKEIQPVHPKGNQSWIFIGRTDVEAEAPVLWPPDVQNWLIGKDPDAGKDWRLEEKGMPEDAIQWWVGWHPWPDGHEFEQALGVGDGHGSLACCRPRGHKDSHTTELNWQDPDHLNDKTQLLMGRHQFQPQGNLHKPQDQCQPLEGRHVKQEKLWFWGLRKTTNEIQLVGKK